MSYKLNWEKLLSHERQRPSTAPTGHRNAFELDYDRIVGSSSVRRLQDKAQVFPLQENDFTRTRLTHSLEVSALAKSLGKAVGREIEKRDQTFDPTKTEELTALLQTLGLIHDLGNPPFGHYGEIVIRQWFEDWFDKNCPQYKKMRSNLKKGAILSEGQKKDFLFFDGNVQNLRIVTKLQMLNDQYGVNFTYATLASLIKYPWSSIDADKKPNNSKKKFGYFQSEKGLVEDIWKATGLEEGVRHPVTFLLEAADDITYICDDIEDGVKKGLIKWEIEFEKIKDMFSDEFYKLLFENLNKTTKTMREDITEAEKKSANVLNFRNVTQGFMIKHVVENFFNKYEQIMNGELGTKELLVLGEMEPFIKHLKNIARESCFNCKEVLFLELIGDKVLKGLLEIFIPAIIEAEDIENTSVYAGKLYHIISPNFKYIANFDYKNNSKRNFSELTLYEKMQLITDYIAGMTDSYAVNLFKELTGYKLPNGDNIK